MRAVLIIALSIAPTAALAQTPPSTRRAAAPQTAPATRPATAPADTPKDALCALNVALRDGETGVIRDLFLTRDEDGSRLIAAMADYANALVVLHKAAHKAYGPDGANIVTGDMAAQSAEGLAAIDKAEVKIDGDEALVKFATASDPPVRLFKVNGTWKVPLGQLLEGADKAAEQRRYKELMHQAALARKTAEELQAGRYREGALKAAEVWRSRLLEPPTTGPATKPS